jgi:hypothetical protein
MLPETFASLSRCLPVGRSSYPLRITAREADKLYMSCESASHVRVLGIERLLP